MVRYGIMLDTQNREVVNELEMYTRGTRRACRAGQVRGDRSCGMVLVLARISAKRLKSPSSVTDEGIGSRRAIRRGGCFIEAQSHFC